MKNLSVALWTDKPQQAGRQILLLYHNNWRRHLALHMTT